ncbi:MAG: hypothetical protein DSM107014_05170 [Gomphosphaeria aponina SAG 52.96 = DSM 107014]|uniref:Uncharacterized protein n=1 Tax=Gomphosphaeria aponina SAG 52.96 = DSM 107014 TaxID=1521640 RepID=A0A941GVY5_9CHRO|nr:hypothetical protein [Gomphosphaeria aponina SAG 52.96 = DSM 107014]
MAITAMAREKLGQRVFCLDPFNRTNNKKYRSYFS